MAVRMQRNRLINFRVSEDELQLLRSASMAGSARSLSDHARSMVLANANVGNDKNEFLARQMMAIHEKLTELNSKLSSISKG